MSDDFFDEVTKEIKIDLPPQKEDTGKTADPVNSAETKIVAQNPSSPGKPLAQQIPVKIPPKMPEFAERKSPQAKVIQESSAPSRMAAPAPPPPIPQSGPPEDVEIELDLSEAKIKPKLPNFLDRGRDSTFRSIPSRQQLEEMVNDNGQSIVIVVIVAVLAIAVVYILKNHGTPGADSGTRVTYSEANWRMKVSRPWLPFGPEPKSWKEFQKSIDQAMVDLGPEER